jgi:hypothetical protein
MSRFTDLFQEQPVSENEDNQVNSVEEVVTEKVTEPKKKSRKKKFKMDV